MSTPQDSSRGAQAPKASRSPWKQVGVLLALSLVLVAGAVVAVRWKGTRRRDALLERLRASGAPVLPSDFEAAPTGENEDARAWLAQFALEEERSADPYPLAGRVSLVRARPAAYLRFGTFTPGLQLPDLQKLPECTALLESVHNEIDEFWNLVDQGLCDPQTLAEHRDCYTSALRARVEHHGAGLAEKVLEACDVVPLSASEFFGEMEATDATAPNPPSPTGIAEAAGLAGNVARLAIANGDPSAAVRALEASFCAARIVAELPDAQTYVAWGVAMTAALDAASVCVSALPPEVDTRRLEQLLAEPQPRSNGLRALHARRALSNRAFARAEDGRDTGDDDLDAQPFVTRWIAWTMLPRMQAEFLEGFETVIANYESAPGAGLTSVSMGPMRPGALVLSLDGVPDAKVMRRIADETQARIELVRLALLARRDGLDAALAECAQRIDPCDGKPVRSRVEGDELVLWSVGNDGVDQGGTSSAFTGTGSPSDIVLRIKVR